MADFKKLTDARDKLNADIGVLVNAGTVSQDKVDALAAEVLQTDTDVLAATGGNPVPLDYTAFDAAVAALKADVNTTQAAIDVATGAIQASTL